MQRLINEIVERAKANRQRIVLPEGTEERTLKAANQILTDGVADLILLGKPEEIRLPCQRVGAGKYKQGHYYRPGRIILRRRICATALRAPQKERHDHRKKPANWLSIRFIWAV